MYKDTTYSPHIQAFRRIFFVIFVIWNRFKLRPATLAASATIPGSEAGTGTPSQHLPSPGTRRPGPNPRTPTADTPPPPRSGRAKARPTDQHGHRHGARAGRRGGAAHTIPKEQEWILITPLDAKKMMVDFFVNTLSYSHFYSQF